MNGREAATLRAGRDLFMVSRTSRQYPTMVTDTKAAAIKSTHPPCSTGREPRGEIPIQDKGNVTKIPRGTYYMQVDATKDPSGLQPRLPAKLGHRDRKTIILSAKAASVSPESRWNGPGERRHTRLSLAPPQCLSPIFLFPHPAPGINKHFQRKSWVQG